MLSEAMGFKGPSDLPLQNILTCLFTQVSACCPGVFDLAKLESCCRVMEFLGTWNLVAVH